MQDDYQPGVGGSRVVRGHEPLVALLLVAVFGFTLLWALGDLTERIAVRAIGARAPAVVDEVRSTGRGFRDITFTYSAADVELTETDRYSALGSAPRDGERIHVHYLEDSARPARVEQAAPLVSAAMVAMFSGWMVAASLTAAGLRAGDRMTGEQEVALSGGTISRPGRRATTVVLLVCTLTIAWRLLRFAG